MNVEGLVNARIEVVEGVNCFGNRHCRGHKSCSFVEAEPVADMPKQVMRPVWHHEAERDDAQA